MSEDAAGLEQLCGRALLGYRAVTQHYDPVCARNGTHPVGDDEDGFVFDETGERLLNGGFVFHIQLAVASSNRMMGASFRKARAMEMR